MDYSKVDDIIKFCLLVAGREEEPNNELGPIHIVKYVYLSDLIFAERHQGITYTNTDWKFHHFGPWSIDVFSRIEPSAHIIGGTERKFQSSFSSDDSVRWTAHNENLFEKLDASLPLEISSHLKKMIRKFGQSTSDLLHYVYNTLPMLSAAPGELLNFQELVEVGSITEKSDTLPKIASYKEIKKKNERIAALRKRVLNRLSTSRETISVETNPLPRYDEIFYEGQKWLDSVDGGDVPSSQGELTFSEEIWHSPGRKNVELS